ncbi:DNA cytosine methyltransferase [Cellulomonas shaoxiangyii]|uniref:DNA cytosine methyltransferase n=1 Tax=Cellulomonas shaoxiangyii TaxID=2566013 RepID=A0A4P7SKP5_9CELL|nr:DNA cytosine methyltransferase [Cellulomonas shaoxiangyii]QCB93324.1 DNA cytosine methyltransferase [Cellulomonas shaoxiangyii]TGY79429.1 DNA cytosine methyltransferase [Cellulomonas shaoxiangyii]
MGKNTLSARPGRPAPLTIDAARELIAQWRRDHPGVPIVLDAFCGEGGAGKGYADAGCLILGVDNDAARLAHYPFPAVLGDAIEAILALGPLVDLAHGSPTCTGYSRGTAAVPDRLDRYDRLIGVTRAAMQETGTAYVIENVADARPEMVEPTMLCWSMFHEPGSVRDTDGTPLTMRRHRLFEASFPITAPRDCRHPRAVQVAGAYGGARRDAWEARHVRKGGYVPASLDVLRALTGLTWATERGTFLSIPPAYTEFVGRQFVAHMTKAVA